MNNWLVYKHMSPNGKIYIGITHLKPEYRWNNGKGYRSNKRFSAAICKYGWDNFIHEIVTENLTEEEAIRKETELIAKYDSTNKKHGYNVSLGGHNHSEESRKKIGTTRKQRHIPSPTTGKHLSEETRKKISNALTGQHRVLSEQARINISNGKRGEKNPNYGKPMRELTRKRLLEARQRPVVRVDGTEKEYFQSATVAQEQTGIASCNICRACKGTRKTAGGYRWEYA